MNLFADFIAGALTGFTRLLTGAQARWTGCAPQAVQRIYYANHTSHADFILIWASLPASLRRHTRPVAGADYWDTGWLRRYLIHQVLHGVLVERTPRPHAPNPIAAMTDALDRGDSLIVFPEGTRNTTHDPLLPFKSGLYHLASRRPQIELIPVWIENLGRVLPKGEIVPLPLLCAVNFGAPMKYMASEEKAAFIARTRGALLALAESVQPK